MLKLAYRYDQTAARLMVEGLPDISADHGQGVIGILSSWKLQFVGSPELEGRREHLEAMLATVLPYARYMLSGVTRPCGGRSLRSVSLLHPLVVTSCSCAAANRVLSLCRSSSMMQSSRIWCAVSMPCALIPACRLLGWPRTIARSRAASWRNGSP